MLFDVDGTRWRGPAALVECLEEELLPTFLALVSDMMATIGDAGDVTADAVIRALGHWELLLRNRALLSEEAQLGLWGELAFVLAAPSIDAALRAWSPGARDPLDFVANGVGVEVKSSVVRLKHSISLNQVASGDGDLEVFFASIWVVPDPTGRNLREMIEAVSISCSEQALLEQKLLVTGYSRAHADAYGRKFALGAQVVIFPGSAIPRVRTWDVGVTSIRFSVELDQEAALEEAPRTRVLSALCVGGGS